MKFQTIKVYRWGDIKEEIFNRMGITPEKFNNYYGLNLWGICVEYLFPPFAVDSIVEVFPFYDQLEFERVAEYLGGRRDFLVTYNEVMTELAGGDDLGVYVKFG